MANLRCVVRETPSLSGAFVFLIAQNLFLLYPFLMHRLIFVFLFALLVFKADLGFAQTNSEAPNFANSDLGSLSFFLDKKKPATQGESLHLVEESQAYFCLKLNAQVPDLAEAAKHLRQIQIVLEGEGDMPQKIYANTKLTQGLIYPKDQGCYIGKFEVPRGIPGGKYRVIDLDLLQASQHVLPLRDHLSQIKPQGMLEIASPINDLQPPLVEKIESWVPLEGKMNMRHSRAWKYIYFRVTATDLNIGIDPSSFQIFFKAYIDDELVDIVKPRCRTVAPNLHYDCNLYFSRAEHDFYGRTLRLVLDSVSVADKYGNLTELLQLEELKKLFDGKLLRYVFYSQKPPKQFESQKAPHEPNANDNDIRSSSPKQDYFNTFRRP